MRQRAPSPRRLGDDERQAIVDAMHITGVRRPAADGGVRDAAQSRRLPRVHPHHLSRARRARRVERAAEISGFRTRTSKPSLTATAPNQVWTWDITKLATLEKGIFLHVYVIIDLFSRYVVGWMVAAKECKHLAAQLFAEAAARHGIEPGLVVHADRGSAMKSDTLAQLLGDRSASTRASAGLTSPTTTRSASAGFKTLKYQPDYPGFFARPAPRPWHGFEHVLRLAQRRAPTFRPRALHARRGVLRPRAGGARRAPGGARRRLRLHPERFPNGAPRQRLPPASVHINPLEALVVIVGQRRRRRREHQRLRPSP